MSLKIRGVLAFPGGGRLFVTLLHWRGISGTRKRSHKLSELPFVRAKLWLYSPPSGREVSRAERVTKGAREKNALRKARNLRSKENLRRLLPPLRGPPPSRREAFRKKLHSKNFSRGKFLRSRNFLQKVPCRVRGKALHTKAGFVNRSRLIVILSEPFYGESKDLVFEFGNKKPSPAGEGVTE